MYEPDPDLLAGESAEDETEDSIMSPIPMGPASPFPASEDFAPKEGSPYEAPVYIPEDIPLPPDFELRESSIPGAGLGVWAKRRLQAGERLGPYVLKDADFGWEVSVPALAGRPAPCPGAGDRLGGSGCPNAPLPGLVPSAARGTLRGRRSPHRRAAPSRSSRQGRPGRRR